MNNNEWQPIETAPDDGTFILVFDSEWGIMIANNYDSLSGWSVMWDDRCTEINPTHWMPLPKPPKN